MAYQTIMSRLFGLRSILLFLALIHITSAFTLPSLFRPRHAYPFSLGLPHPEHNHRPLDARADDMLTTPHPASVAARDIQDLDSFLHPFRGMKRQTTSASSPTSTTASPASTTDAAPAAATTHDSNLTGSTGIGIGVGAGVLVVGIILGIAYLCWRRHNKKKARNRVSTLGTFHEPGVVEQGPGVVEKQGDDVQRAELSGTRAVGEMDGTDAGDAGIVGSPATTKSAMDKDGGIVSAGTEVDERGNIVSAVSDGHKGDGIVSPEGAPLRQVKSPEKVYELA